MSRSTAKYIGVLALTVAIFFWKTLLTNQFTRIIGSEAVNYNYSWLRFWVSSLRQGHLPLWDPYAFCGRPFAGEMLPSAFYPLHLAFLLVPFNQNGLFSPRLYNETFILAHLLCAFFTFALIRELGMSRFAAFVGACCFSLGGLLVRMIWLPFVEAGIWLPAICFFLIRALKAEGPRPAVFDASLSGLCLGLSILTGGLHFSIMQAIVVITAVCYYGVSAPLPAAVSRRSRWLRLALILGLVLAVAGGAGAIQLLPSYEYGKLSMRFIDGGAFPAAQKIPYHRLNPGMWPQAIVSVLFPTGFSGIIGAGEVWPIYIGVLPFFLAVTAIWKCWSDLWVRYLTGLALLAFVYSLSEFSLLHGVLYAIVPYLWVVRTGSRFIYLATFALAILAAFGIDSLLERGSQNVSWNPAIRILKWVAIAAAGALFGPAIFTQVLLPTWIAYSLLLILASCALFSFLATHQAPSAVRALMAAFIVFDLSAFSWVEDNINSPRKPHAQLEQMVNLRGTASFLKSRTDLGRVHVAVSPEPNIGDAYGVQSVWGGGGTVLTGYSRLLQKHEDLLNVRYLVRPAAATEPAPIFQDGFWKVYENPKAYPRAWIVHETRVEASDDAVFRRLDDSSVDLRKVAVLEAPLPQSPAPAPQTDEPVRFRSYEADRIVLYAEASSAGLLILSEIYYPGWRATLNGKPVAIYRVDGALRGILLPRGTSRIALEYVPVTFYTGGALSLLTFASVLTAWLLRWRERHRRA